MEDLKMNGGPPVAAPPGSVSATIFTVVVVETEDGFVPLEVKTANAAAAMEPLPAGVNRFSSATSAAINGLLVAEKKTTDGKPRILKAGFMPKAMAQ